MLGLLCNQTINLETDAKTSLLQFTEIKMYSPSMHLKHNKD